MSEAPERIVPSCVEALENYQQADMDGIMVLVSRQAIHETIDAYWARVEACEKLEAKLAIALQTLKDMRDDKVGFRHEAHFRRRAAVVVRDLTGGKDE